MYETQTEEAIKQRMLDKISTEIDKSEGSFSYDAVAPVAVELAQSYIEIDRILALAFAQNSSGSYLDMRTAEFGITRNTGSKATGTVRFTGSDGVIIPEGTQLQTTGGLVYTTQSSVTISGGTADADVMAEATGIIYNVPAGSINQLPVQIVGVTGVTNNGTLTGGCDVESDEGLLERLLTKVRTPSTSGNANDYKLWALSVSGIGDAKVFPLWNGPGTVKVIVIDAEKKPANINLISSVVSAIETNRPIGATVTVAAAQAIVIDIKLSLTKNDAYTQDQVKDEIIKNITGYLQSIAFKQDYVSYAQIGNVIMSSRGVNDYSNLTVNNGIANIAIGVDQVAVPGVVTL